MCSIRCTKLAPGWALIRVNFDPIQDIGPKVGFQHSLEGGGTFGCSSLENTVINFISSCGYIYQYTYIHTILYARMMFKEGKNKKQSYEHEVPTKACMYFDDFHVNSIFLLIGGSLDYL